jgi:hypothetical protein
MKDLVNFAHSAKNNNDWSEHAKADITFEAYFSRLSAHEKLIQERGGFQTQEEANLVLANGMWETKERCALWLRNELKLLREGEARTGTAPVRNRLALSRSQIADLAVTMLECLPIGDNLQCLVQELLNVDRHRKELATSDVNLEIAAQIEAHRTLQGLPCGVQQLAKCVAVRPSSVTRWRSSDKYRKRVEYYRRHWSNYLRDEYFENIKREHGLLTDEQRFRHAFRMYAESLPARQAWMPQPPELATSDVNLEIAAQIEAQRTLQGFPCGVQQLASVAVGPSSVTRWRRSDKYRERVEFYRRHWSSYLRDQYFENIKREHGSLTDEQCFRHAFRMYAESFPLPKALVELSSIL